MWSNFQVKRDAVNQRSNFIFKRKGGNYMLKLRNKITPSVNMEREYGYTKLPDSDGNKLIFPSIVLGEIESYLRQGGRVFVLDMNGLLSPKCAPMGAKTLSLCADMSLSINPYTNIPEKVFGYGEKIRNHMQSLLRQIIFNMSSPLSDSQKMFIDQSLNHSWLKEGSGASMDTIVTFLLNHDRREANDLGRRLEKFSSRGNYGPLFQGPCQLDLSGAFHAINLSTLWVYPSLRTIVLQFLLLAIFQETTKQTAPVDEGEGSVGQESSYVSNNSPFLIVIEDTQGLLLEEKAHEFKDMYHSIITGNTMGKLLISNGVV